MNSDALSVREVQRIEKAFREPNYTQVPNDLMDRLLPDLTGAELKVLLYLVRRTFGFHRNSTEIGLRRICHGQPGKDRGTGLHLETVSDAVKSLEGKGLLTATRDPGGRTTYLLAVSPRVYGKSEQSCSENPNRPVYGKTAHVERKSSSTETNLQKETPRSQSMAPKPRLEEAAPKPKTATKTPSRNVDDEKPQNIETIKYASPEAEIQDVYRMKTGMEISLDLLRRISETCELRGVTMTQYVEALRPHVPNPWKNPGGFLTDFGRKIHSKAPGAIAAFAARIDPVVRETGRCDRCSGVGRQGEEYCGCKLGQDLKRVEHRAASAPAPALSTPTNCGEASA